MGFAGLIRMFCRCLPLSLCFQLFRVKHSQLVETGNKTTKLCSDSGVSFVRVMQKGTWMGSIRVWIGSLAHSLRSVAVFKLCANAVWVPTLTPYFYSSTSHERIAEPRSSGIMGIVWCRNHSRSHELLSSVALPAEFTWCNKDGVNYCTESHNQHIPQYCGSRLAHGSASAFTDYFCARRNAAQICVWDVLSNMTTTPERTAVAMKDRRMLRVLAGEAFSLSLGSIRSLSSRSVTSTCNGDDNAQHHYSHEQGTSAHDAR